MVRGLRIVLWVVLVILLGGSLLAAVGLAAARWTMPASACAVSENAIASLELEKMTESDVVSRLGCDGVHAVELDDPQIRIETVSWRGDGWPYAVFEAYLINGVLHGTKKIWLHLSVKFPQHADTRD
jgi:hypothetical protein